MISVDSMEAAVVAGGGRAPSLGDVFRDVPVIGALDTKRYDTKLFKRMHSRIQYGNMLQHSVVQGSTVQYSLQNAQK